MNSNFSKYEKSVQECINYDFDAISTPETRKSKLNSSRLQSENHIINGESDKFIMNWLDCKQSYSWLFVSNKSYPKCSICDAAIRESNEIAPSSWTCNEMNLENTDTIQQNLDEEKILQIHMTSDIHIKSTEILAKNRPEIKITNCDFLDVIPSFISYSEWNYLKSRFSWLNYRNDTLSCFICEKNLQKQRKSISTLNVFGVVSLKNQRDFKILEKHGNKLNHQPIKNSNLIDKKAKIETKRVSSPIQRKSIISSQPNVTTRTAIRKSQLRDRNIVPDSIDESEWNELKSEFPWVYQNQNVLACTYCEDAYKTHSETMLPTSWTNPETSENRQFSSLKDLRSKYRLKQHQTTKNHETATRVLSIFKPINAISIKKPEITTKTVVSTITLPAAPLPVIESNSIDFRVPSTVRASRKSAPVKLINSNHSFNEPCKSVKVTPKISTETIPSYLNKEQYDYLKTKYDWLNLPKENSYSCSICLEAIKIDPDAMIKTKFVTGPDATDPIPTYVILRKRVYRHGESKSHSNAKIIIDQFNNSSSALIKKPMVNRLQQSPQSISASQSSTESTRFTRLKSGSKTKIDYKRMSEGNIQTDEQLQRMEYEVINLRVETPPRKRKESSSVASIGGSPPSTSSVSPWVCPQCKSHFRNTDDLIQHISLCDYCQPSDSNNHQLACPCNPLAVRFNTITKLDLHAAQEHDNQSYFHCYICSDRYNRLTALYHHMLINHLISTWDPFEAYLPIVKSSEIFLCLFCSSDFSSNLLLTRHYLLSDCRIRLQPTVVLEYPIPGIIESLEKCLIQEEVTVLDVEELPDEKSELIYSPVKKPKSQHNRISRNHPLRRFCADKRNKIKESPKKQNEIIADQNITDSINTSINTEIIDDKSIIINKSQSNKSIEPETNKSVIDHTKSDEIDKSISSNNNNDKEKSETNDNVINLNSIDRNSNENKKQTNNNNKIITPRNRTSKKIKTKKSGLKSPKQSQPIEMIHQVVDLNAIMNETHNNNNLVPMLTESKPSAITTTETNMLIKPQKRKKEPIRIQSQLSPCKKQLKTIIIAQSSMVTNDNNDDIIPAGLSFMDRMKKIRQLKKNRTEQQREQMMAVDRKIAEINEQFKQDGGSGINLSLIDKSERIKKLLSSDQYSMEDLKSIIQSESAMKSVRPEKRKISEELKNNELTGGVGSTTPKQPKITIDNPIKPTISPMKTENFSCNVCNMKFKSLRARDSHTTSEHKGLKLFCCKVCDLSFTTHILLRKHAQKYHIDNVSLAVFGKENASSEINFSFPCSFCPLQFTSRSGLNHHITSGHRVDTESTQVGQNNEFINKLIAADPNFSPQSCLICQEIMNNEFELDIHTIEHQKECQDAEIEPTQFACPKCCRLFFGRDGKSYLKDHYNIIHLSKPLPNCEECDTKFSSTVCYSMHRKGVKNCSKKTPDQLKIEDPYEKLNDPLKLAFVCSRCQTLVAGQSAETRFEEHKIECNAATDKIDESPFVIHSQTECVDNGQ